MKSFTYLLLVASFAFLSFSNVHAANYTAKAGGHETEIVQKEVSEEALKKKWHSSHLEEEAPKNVERAVRGDDRRVLRGNMNKNIDPTQSAVPPLDTRHLEAQHPHDVVEDVPDTEGYAIQDTEGRKLSGRWYCVVNGRRKYYDEKVWCCNKGHACGLSKKCCGNGCTNRDRTCCSHYTVAFSYTSYYTCSGGWGCCKVNNSPYCCRNSCKGWWC